MAEIDNLDRAIVRILQSDGRVSNREIGRQLGISEGTVRVRLRRLEKHGNFKLVTLKEPKAFGYNCLAYVRFAVDPKYAGDASSIIFDIGEFFFVSIVLSYYNIYAMALTKDRKTLDKIIKFKILNKIEVIDHVVLEEQNTMRFDYHWTV